MCKIKLQHSCSVSMTIKLAIEHINLTPGPGTYFKNMVGPIQVRIDYDVQKCMFNEGSY